MKIPLRQLLKDLQEASQENLDLNVNFVAFDDVSFTDVDYKDTTQTHPKEITIHLVG